MIKKTSIKIGCAIDTPTKKILHIMYKEMLVVNKCHGFANCIQHFTKTYTTHEGM